MDKYSLSEGFLISKFCAIKNPAAQRREIMKDAEKFGKYLGEIAEEAAQAMGENNVPFFLQNPIQTLHNLTPIQLVWF